MENKFILAKLDRTLLAIDQHAIHERINLEHLESLIINYLNGDSNTYSFVNLHKFEEFVF